MRVLSMMCFSSSIICLLIVTTHSSIVPDQSEVTYGKDDRRSTFHGNSHISSKNFAQQRSHSQEKTGSLKNSLNITAHRQKHFKDLMKEQLNSVNQNSRTTMKVPFARRKQRAAADEFVLPLPKPKEVPAAHVQRRNSHSEHVHSARQSGGISSNMDMVNVLSNSHNHNRRHPNGTSDLDLESPPSESDDSHHNHEVTPSGGDVHHMKDIDESSHVEDHLHHHHDSKHSDDYNYESNEELSGDIIQSPDVKDPNLNHDVIICNDKKDGHETNRTPAPDCPHEHEHDHHHDHDHNHSHDHNHEEDNISSGKFQKPRSSNTRNITGREWLYASLAVVIISLCGLFSVAVIPIMQKWFYHTLLQFLVGLAIGSLSGDGLLHLMPHAILDGEGSHDHSKGNNHHHENGESFQSMEKTAIWRGLAALGGIFLFFIAERLLGALTAYRKHKREAKLSRHPKNMIPVIPREDGANNGNVGEKLAQPKKNSYDHIRDKDEKETIQMLQTEATPSRIGSNQSVHEIGFHGRSSFSLEPEATVAYKPDSESSVIVSEHHGHGHGHSHEIPQSVTAVAWMVIMGDGLHNFCDGLAIGAAFASGDADGVSTTVAVFCHELPHELGDFAMLLKTGMKVKQALFYNGLSSVLCFVGMVIGVSLGNVHSATNWVFAGTSGMFLYIALVDMLPELSNTTNESGQVAMSTLAVQVCGITIGISIMLLIALYEHELHSIVS